MDDVTQPARPRRLGRVIGLAVGVGLTLLTIAVLGAVFLLAPSASAAGGCGGG